MKGDGARAPAGDPGQKNGEDGGHRANSVPPRAAKLILRCFFIVCAGVAAADLLFQRDRHHPWEAAPIFYPVLGFLGIAGLILISKGLRRLVMRSEDYYDDG